MGKPFRLSSWLTALNLQADTQLRLFIFPYAGAGPPAFWDWPEYLPDDVELVVVQFPGRGDRLNEPYFRQLSELIAVLMKEIRDYFDRPFAFFGHSLGALVAFELSRSLRQISRSPEHLYISGYPAPQLPYPNPRIHGLSDEDFMEELQKFSGTPKAVLECPELIEMVLPTIKADFEVLETYEHVPSPPFEFPISAYGGVCDPQANQEQLDAWRDQTTSAFSLTMFEGDHFFFNNKHKEIFFKKFSGDLRNLLNQV